MLYPKNIETKLSFDTIRILLEKKCLSALGIVNVYALRFSQDYGQIHLWLRQTHEMKALLSSDQPLPLDTIHDIQNALQKAVTPGSFFNEEELHKLRLSLITMKGVFDYFAHRKDIYAALHAIVADITYDQTVVTQIEFILDKEGNIKKNASKELLDIVTSISTKEAMARKRIQSIFKNAESQGWLASTGITLREGRMVLPILAEHKRKIKGITHDESATGQTLFIEPEEILEINNEINELYFEKRRETIKILIKLTDAVRPSLPAIKNYFKKLGIIDFVRAKALVAIDLKADMPTLKKEAMINYKNAFHPLLFLALNKDNKKVVPLSLQLHRENRICVISGPNAGGKSVSLKTIGLLQYMLQCGLLVCMDTHSEAGIFDDLFIDIGDEQSIENDLSTYSSHLKNMKHFVNFSGKKSLVLIDELCTGTDPQFGGPIGEGVLSEITNNQSFGVITTHFSNIKTFANNTQGVFNASMGFDTQTLQPLYQLQVGNPGSSYSIEIAQKIGLNKTVVNYAKSKLDAKQQRVEHLLVELEKERVYLHKAKQENQVHAQELKHAIDENVNLNKELTLNKKKIISDAQLQAKNLLENTNRQIEAIIKEIRETQADKERTVQLRKKLKDEHAVLEKQIFKDDISLNTTTETMQVGDFVKMQGKTVVGEIIKINNKKATVAFENLYSTVALSELVKVVKPKQSISHSALDLTMKSATFVTTLDIRGERGNDALLLTEKFIDDALLLGFDKLKILHGKGDGILKNLLWQLFKRHKFVANYESEKEEFGGSGITVIELK
ncbi:MAG: Smr/MutS family protein [Bacteroidetes bacterium]|nr:Smr/MutS family protein [Bacteroidota bacterium]